MSIYFLHVNRNVRYHIPMQLGIQVPIPLDSVFNAEYRPYYRNI